MIKALKLDYDINICTELSEKEFLEDSRNYALTDAHGQDYGHVNMNIEKYGWSRFRPALGLRNKRASIAYSESGPIEFIIWNDRKFKEDHLLMIRFGNQVEGMIRSYFRDQKIDKIVDKDSDNV